MTRKPKNPQFSNAGCIDTWNCPACYRAFAEKEPGHVTCRHCGQESELTLETQPICISKISNARRGN